MPLTKSRILTINSQEFILFYHNDHQEKFVDRLINELLIDKVYETDTAKILPGFTVVDGGACLGIYTLYAIANGASKVIGFEPDTKLFPILQRTIIENNITDKVELHNIALWKSSEKLKLFHRKSNPFGSRVVSPNIHNIYYVSGNILDSFNLKVDFIKLDIEGCEVEALEGSIRTIEENKPVIAVATYHKQDDIYNISRFMASIKYTNIGMHGDSSKISLWEKNEN